MCLLFTCAVGFIETVTPSNGPLAGGNDVTISGVNLGNGNDIIAVTLAGAVAAIRSQSAQSVVVTAGRPAAAGLGMVIVTSNSVGSLQLADGYRYNPGTAPQEKCICK